MEGLRFGWKNLPLQHDLGQQATNSRGFQVCVYSVVKKFPFFSEEKKQETS